MEGNYTHLIASVYDFLPRAVLATGQQQERPIDASGRRLITQGRLDIAITEVRSLADVPAVHQLPAESRGDGKYVARLQG